MEDLKYGYYVVRKDLLGKLKGCSEYYKVTMLDFDGQYCLLKIQYGSKECEFLAEAITTIDGKIIKNRKDGNTGNYVNSIYNFILP